MTRVTSFISELGPRARRRFAWLSVVALAAVGIGAFYAATSVGRNSKQEAIPTMNLGIPYGTTPRQLLARLGPPDRRRGNCWTYAAHAGSVRSIYAGEYTDAVRFCFVAGIVSDIHDHEIAYTYHHIRIRAKWILPLTFAPPWATTFQM